MSFRAFFLDPGSSPRIVDLYSHFTDKEIEPQKGDDLPKVSHVPSKAVTLNPNFGLPGGHPFYHITVCLNHLLPVAGGSWERPGGLSPTSRSGQVEKVFTGRYWDKCHGTPCSSPKAGLRRSFRLGRRERMGSLQEGKMSTVAESLELLTYEEVTRYQHQPGERPRLVVLIGR